LRLSPSIDTHDIQVKLNKAIEFLKTGNKVKISVRFRGREMGHTDIALNIMKDFGEKVSEYGVIEKPPKVEARTMAMFISPKA